MEDTNNTQTSSTCRIPFGQGTSLVAINSLLAPVGTIGNLLIVFAISNTPQLHRRVSNYLLLSLAVADMLVTICPQPLLIIWLCFATFRHQCLPGLDRAYDITVNILCGSSLFHLAAISIDRAISILKPHRYRDIVSKIRVKVVIAICWVVSVVIVCFRIPFPKESAFFGICIFFAGYVLFIGSYGAIIYKVVRAGPRRNTGTDATKSSSERNRAIEKKVCEAVGIVTLIFSLCWIPVFLYLLLIKGSSEDVTYSWMRTLYLSNSSVNFIVYSWRIDQFRSAFKKTINRIVQRFGFTGFRNIVGLTESLAASKSNPTPPVLTPKEEKHKESEVDNSKL